MTAKQSYQRLLDGVFQGAVQVDDPHGPGQNNVTGAVQRHEERGEFRFFTDQLRERLARLNAAFQQPREQQIVREKVAGLALSNGYMGRLAELAAYDCFSSFTKIGIELTVPAARTLASELPNRQASSLDGQFTEFDGIWFDVKSFTHVCGEIVDNIKSAAERSAVGCRVAASYPYHLAYDSVSPRFGEIVAGIRTAASSQQRTYHHPDVPELQFQILSSAVQVTATHHQYSPAELLDAVPYFVLNHFDQILRDEPNILVYVVHPWLNSVQSDFTRQEEFYREFCRKVFEELSRDTAPLSQALPPKAPGVDVPTGDVIRRLSGIMFLEDRTVEPPEWYDRDSPAGAVRGWLFVNGGARDENQAVARLGELSELASSKRVSITVQIVGS